MMGHGVVATAQSSAPNGNQVYLELGALGFIVPAHDAALGAGGIFQVAAGDSGAAFELRYAAGGPSYDSNFLGVGMNLHWLLSESVPRVIAGGGLGVLWLPRDDGGWPRYSVYSFYLDLGLELLRQPHSRLTLITRAELPTSIFFTPNRVQFSLMLIYGVR